jgi:hypothetical protein
MVSDCDADARGLVNMSWALASLGVADHPLRYAIAAAALPKIKDFNHQGLSNISWAFATLLF